MRSLSSGYLKFGTLGVGLPIKIYKARDTPDSVSFHNGCSCGGRLRHENVCDKCQQKVAYGDIVKLFDDNGKLVRIDKALLPKLEGGDVIINGFMKADEFFSQFGNPMLAFTDFYLLGWDRKKEKGIKESLSGIVSFLKEGYVGYGTLVIRTKEHKVALMVSKDGLMVVELANPSDIRDNEFSLDGKANSDIRAFVSSLVKPIDEAFWIDHTQEAIRKAIGGEVVDEPKIDFLKAIKKEVVVCSK